MYILINRSGLLTGIFSTKEKMRTVIEMLIKDDKEKNGTPCGHFHFRYAKIKIDEPWFTNDGKESLNPEANAILSFATMHTEKFLHEVETDWSTGKIIKL